MHPPLHDTHTTPVEIIPASDSGLRDVAIPGSAVRDRIAADWILDQTRENTASAYRTDIREWFAWCDRWEIDVITATPTHVRGYRRQLAHPDDSATAYADATQHRKLCSVSSFYRFATENHGHIIGTNPAANVKRPKVANESTTVALELDELRALLRVADDTGLWESAFVRMVFYSGARISEICNATVPDLRWERGSRTLWVVRKGGQRLRLVIPTPAADALAAHLGERRTGALFTARGGRPLLRQTAAAKLGKLVRAAGIVDADGQPKRITPHSLRHTAVTLALDSGADIREVQRMVGHTKLDTTMRYDRSRSAVDRSPTHGLAATVEPVPVTTPAHGESVITEVPR